MLVYAELSAEVWLLFIVTMFKNTRQILSYDIMCYFWLLYILILEFSTILRLVFLESKSIKCLDRMWSS